MTVERESMEFDVVIVGAGPAGLSTACRLRQLNPELSVVVVEKGSEVGAHILSGAVFEPTALNELFPNWKADGAPLETAVVGDDIHMLTSAEAAIKVPHFAVPKTMHNEGNYIISLGRLCRWLAEHTANYTQGMELHGKYTLFAEGCRGHLGKQLIARFKLDAGKDPQHYGIGIKEIWEIPAEKHKQGLVVHSAGWPLTESGSAGGGFLYHIENNQVAVGLITDLSYSNPHVSPFEEFQRYKTHPVIRQYLEGGKRTCYGARAITKGGLQSQPKMQFPGGFLIGDDAGTLNFAKIKGSHTAMKSGMIAAETIATAIATGKTGEELTEFAANYETSWAYKELWMQRNFGPAQHKFGNIIGSAYAFFDINIFNGALPWTLRDPKPDYAQMVPASEAKKIEYPKPDNKLSFDRLSCHLRLTDPNLPIARNLPLYDEPAQRYCPAGVYEVVSIGGKDEFKINGQNCVHCKTCDIKDPAQNITWVVPEGSGGPNYPNM